MLKDDGRIKAREHAQRVINRLTPEQKSLGSMLAEDLLFEAYMQGRWDACKEQRTLIKELMHDINFTGFSFDSVKLTLEDWLEE